MYNTDTNILILGTEILATADAGLKPDDKG
jgi:hypothetical protein